MADSITRRRRLRLNSLEDVWDDVARLDDAAEQRSIGKWSAAQNVEHLALMIDASLNGFARKLPLPMRMFGALIKGGAMRKTMSAGYTTPRQLAQLTPGENVRWIDATRHLRRTLDHIGGGARMNQPSPFFGKMTHEQWEQMHCRHAELHLSFVHPVGTSRNASGEPIGAAPLQR